MTNFFTDKLVLVTGASSGIGRSLAIRLGADGGRIALVGRRRNALEETAMECEKAGAQRTACFPCDLTNSAAIAKLVVAIEETFGRPVDTFVHSAGDLMIGRLEDIPLAAAENCFSVNVMAAIALVQAVIPGMKAVGAGQIPCSRRGRRSGACRDTPYTRQPMRRLSGSAKACGSSCSPTVSRSRWCRRALSTRRCFKPRAFTATIRGWRRRSRVIQTRWRKGS